MKKILAVLLCMLLCLGGALAEDIAGEFETEFDFSDGVEMVYVSSFEEAAQHYTGEIPSFTAPEGFELVEILVNEFGLTAYYSSTATAPVQEGEDAAETAAVHANFEFSMYDYGSSEGMSYYNLSDGVLTDATAAMVVLYEEGGVVYSADVHTTRGAIYFYFDGLDNTQVEAVLTGLEA